MSIDDSTNYQRICLADTVKKKWDGTIVEIQITAHNLFYVF